MNEIVGYAEKARRDGLLALDEAVKEIDDPFTQKGIQLVVDGTDPDLVAAVLDAENEAMRKRHSAGRAPFMQAGALAPTMGIVGTVFGLVNVMNNLNNPSSLGPLIAAAFLATLIGVGSANVRLPPVANRLKELSEAEMHFREMTLEGILGIQAGDNPRVVVREAHGLRAAVGAPDRGAAGRRDGRGQAGGLRLTDERGAAAQEAPPRGAREPRALARLGLRHDDAAVRRLRRAVRDLLDERLARSRRSSSRCRRPSPARCSPAARR